MNELTTRKEEDFAIEAAFVLDGPSGFEDVTADCVTIPFLKIAQSNTPEAKYRDPLEIDGLKPGMFFCSTTRKVYGESVQIIILKFYRQYIIYESKDPGAKFVGTMRPEQFKQIENRLTRERSYHLDEEGKRYVDTRNFIVLLKGHFEDGPMIMSLSSTGIKPSKQLLTMATNVCAPDGRQAPIWSSGWQLETGVQSNDAGQSYSQITRITRLGFVPASIAKKVVSTFLDVQSYGGEVLDESVAKDHDQKPASDQATSPVGRNPADRKLGVEDAIFGDDSHDDTTF